MDSPKTLQKLNVHDIHDLGEETQVPFYTLVDVLNDLKQNKQAGSVSC